MQRIDVILPKPRTQYEAFMQRQNDMTSRLVSMMSRSIKIEVKNV